ncbi:MAG: DUF2147 domain-containing protein [Flavobacteriaceae bacterium]|jgi:uncharacterized protein (DUF2147 family)|uniref:DUF2147 domain-containing protein n=1 Tax=Flavobacterium kayseriense TaxID=2764714 RepID=A0ABR7JBV8_9FLAO|nr:DUF2147 domain-containing protein [Flavobacterium kayseriense]MBC5842707.1 DUF2147 domain-containing protein [Flavobacterium kayseriense]MBC5849237.1 DUF2147 domain-containing protein [Flavobacterium kayseriense]MBU0941182.1 DUF2147 domain-containing protein [Bacteroidota bacterium]MBX9887037.1 DUF2147 domain-containing protein [Flavobacteriaceae bacterium]
MRNTITVALLFMTTVFFAQSQGVLGKWKTIDDQTGEAKSIIEIYEKSGKVYGKVVEILNPARKKDLCQNCEGEDKGKAILNLVILKGLEKDGDEYNGGKITDPQTGKVYKCLMTLEEKDKLKVRGYIGFSLIGRTQYWYRVKS